MVAVCRKCGRPVEPFFGWHRGANRKLQLRAYCPHCGSFLKNVPQTAANRARAGDPPPVAPANPGLFGEDV